jgi:hypothetical protein
MHLYLASLEEEPYGEVVAIRVSKVELGGEYKYDLLAPPRNFKCTIRK